MLLSCCFCAGKAYLFHQGLSGKGMYAYGRVTSKSCLIHDSSTDESSDISLLKAFWVMGTGLRSGCGRHVGSVELRRAGVLLLLLTYVAMTFLADTVSLKRAREESA